MRTIIFSLAIGVLFANGVLAADCCGPAACCNRTHERCGQCGVQKTCKVVCEMKTVKTSCWVVECEEFCPPLPGCRGCKSSCGNGCDIGCDIGCDQGCGVDHCASVVKPMVPPKCGKVRSRKILVKKEITCEVPVYKCVVVCCNPGCCQASCCDEEAAPAEPPIQEGTTDTFAPPPVLGAISYLKTTKAGR